MVDAEFESRQRDTFGYFLHETNPHNGLVRDKTGGRLAGQHCRRRFPL